MYINKENLILDGFQSTSLLKERALKFALKNL